MGLSAIVTLRRSAFTHKVRILCKATRSVDYIQVLEDTLQAYVLGHKGRGLIAFSGIRLQQ